MARKKSKPGDVVTCGGCNRKLVDYLDTAPPDNIDPKRYHGPPRFGPRPTTTVLCPTCGHYTTVEI